MENKQQKLFSALSLCRRAAKLTTGFDAVVQSAYDGKAELILLAADVSEGTERRLRRACEDLVPCEKMPLTQLEMCPITRKKVGVYAIIDQNLAKLCAQYLEQQKEDNE